MEKGVFREIFVDSPHRSQIRLLAVVVKRFSSLTRTLAESLSRGGDADFATAQAPLAAYGPRLLVSDGFLSQQTTTFRDFS
jgi:hypothetical protein